MTRIISGSARGRRLAVPPKGTRPTSDRAREGLFNSLETMLDFDGCQVLDLFAGSGAVGLEALSRGAASATLVESGPTVVQVLKANVATVGLPGAVVVALAVSDYLRGGPAPLSGFDLVFADPPYAFSPAELTPILRTLGDGGWLQPDAIAVVERSARGAELQWPSSLEHIKQKRYGEALLWYGQLR